MTQAFMVFLALGLPVLSMAEEQDVERGQRVRVTTTAGDRLTGRVGEKTSDAFVVELDDDRGSQTIPLVDVTTLETGRPQSRCQSAWSKAKWWALIGAASGLTLGFQHEQVGEDGSSFAEAAALGAWSGGLLGGPHRRLDRSRESGRRMGNRQPPSSRWGTRPRVFALGHARVLSAASITPSPARHMRSCLRTRRSSKERGESPRRWAAGRAGNPRARGRAARR